MPCVYSLDDWKSSRINATLVIFFTLCDALSGGDGVVYVFRVFILAIKNRFVFYENSESLSSIIRQGFNMETY